MNKKLQVFVSSTYTDLIEERQAAVQAILDAGHIPAGMELFKAGKSQMKTIRKWIDDSDVYMLILGGRYGSIEEDSGLSYTELEYRYAISKNMPVVAIVLDDSFLFTKAASDSKDSIFEKDNIDKYETFKKFVQTSIVKFAKNIDNISFIISTQLNHILDDPEYDLIGWIRDANEKRNSSVSLSTTKIGDYTYEQIDRLLTSRNFTFKKICLINQGQSDLGRSDLGQFVLGQSDLRQSDLGYSVNAKIIFIKYFNIFCEGYKKNINYRLLHKSSNEFYDTVIPFFVQLKLLKEVKLLNYPNDIVAKITKNGLLLYAMYNEKSD